MQDDARHGLVVLPPIAPPSMSSDASASHQQSSSFCVGDVSAQSVPVSSSSSATANISRSSTDNVPLVDRSLNAVSSSLVSQPFHTGKRARSMEPQVTSYNLASLHGVHTHDPTQARSCSPVTLRDVRRKKSGNLSVQNSTTSSASLSIIPSLNDAPKTKVSQPISYASPMASPGYATAVAQVNAQSSGAKPVFFSARACRIISFFSTAEALSDYGVGRGWNGC